MPMRIQIRHALGTEEIDLPARGAERAIIVGQGANADVKIPSLDVKPRHCAIFVHKGTWAIQDLSGGNTYLNSQKLMQPNRLKVGYKIRLGEDPKSPRIQIVNISADGATGSASVQSSALQSSRGATSGGASSAEESAMGDDTMGDDNWDNDVSALEAATAGGTAAPMFASFSAPAAPRTGQPRGKSYSTESAMTIAIIAMVVVVVGGGLVVWGLVSHADKRNEKAKETIIHETVVVQAPTPPSSKRQTIFSPDAGEPARHAAPVESPDAMTGPVVTPTTVAAFGQSTKPAVPQTPSEDPALKAAAAEPEWTEIETAHDAFRYTKLIWLCTDYARSKPQSPLLATAKKYRDEALDGLWWDRIGQVLDQAETLLNSAKSYRDEIAATPNIAPDAKAALERSAKDNEDQASFFYRLLAEDMSWPSKTKPNVDDAAPLEEARKKRDSNKYAEWCASVLKTIEQSRGSRVPWDSK